MREGIKRGVTYPKSVMRSALPQFKQLVAASPQDSIYYSPVKNFPASFSDADKRQLTKLYGDTIAGKLNPALARLAAFLEKEYLPAARTNTGWDALPNGAEWYKVRVASQTTTNLTPEHIHAIGLHQHRFLAVR